jgi:hypothetical protein
MNSLDVAGGRVVGCFPAESSTAVCVHDRGGTPHPRVARVVAHRARGILRTPQSETHLSSPGSKPSAFPRVVRVSSPPASVGAGCPANASVRFGAACTPAARLPSSRSLTASTACASIGLVRMLQRAADHEVHRVSKALPSQASERRAPSPHRCHTLQSIPLLRSGGDTGAVPCLHALARTGPGGLRGLAPLGSPLRHPDVSVEDRPRLSWASWCVFDRASAEPDEPKHRREATTTDVPRRVSPRGLGPEGPGPSRHKACSSP